MSKKDKNILGNSTTMRIKARIKVLEASLGKSGNKLGREAGLGNATVDGWTDKQIDKPTLQVETFLRHYSINEDWWRTGEGEVFNEKPTYVDLPTRKEKDPDEHIRILIKNLDRMGELNEYLLKELKRLQGG